MAKTCSVIHGARLRCGGVFWLVEKTTCQSGSSKWTNDNLFKNCHVVAIHVVFSNLLKSQFCTVQYHCIFELIVWMLICIIWMLLRELDKKTPYFTVNTFSETNHDITIDVARWCAVVLSCPFSCWPVMLSLPDHVPHPGVDKGFYVRAVFKPMCIRCTREHQRCEFLRGSIEPAELPSPLPTWIYHRHHIQSSEPQQGGVEWMGARGWWKSTQVQHHNLSFKFGIRTFKSIIRLKLL